VHSAVFAHFADHFKGCHADRHVVDDLHFRTLTQMDGGNLIKLFSLEEAKVAVRDYV